ncbi:hypothetical protein [Gephyromycinifex aptenodytis]|uniref:hypothetical protein n=1 Tax=Gephyromycinifex aptenodytis TaxID=2716227 RepID=UPI001447963B|nr:hypothetical protein [Gephyromycinifex aptenodytis]
MNDMERLSDAATAVSRKIRTVGVNGAGPWQGSIPVAEEHLRHHRGVEAAIGRLIATHVRVTAATGFASNVGGLVTLPLSIPADAASLWMLQARLAGSIAHLRGYEVHSEEVQSIILLSLIGSAGAEALKEAGVKVGQKGAISLINKVPGKALLEINRRVGFRLITRAGSTGVVNLTKFVPLAGGVVGGTVNGVSTKAVGGWAKRNFPAAETVTDSVALQD